MATITSIDINKKIYDALKDVLEIPDNITSLKLELEIDSFPKIEVNYIPILLKENVYEKKKAYFDCISCYHFDTKDETCDMCAFGGYMAIDNNGNKPSEVKECNTYTHDVK